MKIYFAGPLFTPYVRNYISEHADILRKNGIEPFVPHEKFNSMISPERVDILIQQGVIGAGEVGEKFNAEAVMELVRKGRLTHEQLGLSETNPAMIFETDYAGLAEANAVVALLDGTQVDDGTACEIGIFYAMTRTDPTKKGVLGFVTDFRGTRQRTHGFGQNMFVLGVIEECGAIYDNFADVIRRLKSWNAELNARL